VSTQIGSSGGPSSLWNNPQLLSALLPNLNLQSLQQAMQAQLNVDEIPLSNMSQQLQTVQSQLSAWQALQSGLNALQTDAQNLGGSSLYQGLSAGSSNAQAVGATASGTGTPGSYQVQVTGLMRPEIDNSAAQSSASAALGYSGTFSVNGTTVQVAPTDSLQTIAQSINTAGAGVTATVLPSGGAYVLNLASTQGQPITWGDGAGILQGLGVLGPGVSPADQLQSAQAATYSINGVNETSPSATDSTSIPGVTLNLLATTGTTPVTVSVTQNQGSITSGFEQLASDYNNLIGTLNTYAGPGGVLEGNATVLGIGNTLQDVLAGTDPALPSGYQSLNQTGVTISAPVGSPNQLSMSVNTGTLQAALQANSGDVAALMNTPGSGVAQQLTQQLGTLLGPTGSIGGEISDLQSQMGQLSTQINDPNSAVNMMINAQQQGLQTDFENMLTALVSSQSQGQQIQGFMNAAYGQSYTSSGSSRVL